jgi:hypothetical protein
MLVKDHAVSALMASLKFYTDRMLGFMGPDKPSSFVTTLSNCTSLLHVVLLLLEGE